MAGMYPSNERKLLLFWIILLLLIIIAAGIFMPVSMVVKAGLFVLIAGGVFLAYRFLENAELFPGTSAQTDGDEPEPDDDTDADSDWDGFGKAFENVCQEYLGLLRQSLVASCAGFYIQKPSGVLELQSGDDDGNRSDIGAVVPPGNVIETVWKTRTAVLQSKVSSDTYLPGMTDQELKSLVGVPVLWQDTFLGVLILGSDTQENFSDDDKNLLNRYGMLIARLMNDYHHGLKDEMRLDTYRIHLEIENGLRTVQNERDAMQVFVNHLRTLITFDRLVLSIRHGDQAIVRYVYGPLDDMDVGSQFPLDEGLTGWIIRRNMPLLIPDILAGDYRRPRFKKDENHRHGMRCFLGVPLANHTTAWGALSLESAYTGQFDDQSKQALTHVSLHLEAILNRIYAQGVISAEK